MEYVSGRDMRQVLDAMKKAGFDDPGLHSSIHRKQCCGRLGLRHHKADANGNNLNLIHRDVSPQIFSLAMTAQ